MGIGVVLTAPPATAGASSGGAYSSDPARITAVDCVAGCANLDSAKAGSLVRVRGRKMQNVAKIVFLAGRGDRDNAIARVVKTRRESVDVRVPATAFSGRLRAVNSDGARSRPSRATVSIQRGGGSNAALDVRVIGRRVFYGAARPARIDLMAQRPMNLDIVLVRVIDGAVVAGWPLALQPGVATSLTWDGRSAGEAQPTGRYEFRVTDGSTAPTGAVAAQSTSMLATGGFDLVDHRFPVRGRHSYGEGAAAFGAGRGGRSHQGQDVFARCGTPLVAARGGVVKLSSREGRAGNYVVIDGEDTDVDYAYMHLQHRSPLKKGDRVLTGQRIGNVGQTGAASGCHLHFEMWSGPGWYAGGQPIDPLAFLRAWDAYG